MFPNQEIGACDPLLFWDPIGSLADGWLRFQLADAFNPKTFENFVYIYICVYNPNTFQSQSFRLSLSEISGHRTRIKLPDLVHFLLEHPTNSQE